MKRSWEIIADKLSKAGWSFGWVSAIDREGRTLWIVDAHRDNDKPFSIIAVRINNPDRSPFGINR